MAKPDINCKYFSFKLNLSICFLKNATSKIETVIHNDCKGVICGTIIANRINANILKLISAGGKKNNRSLLKGHRTVGTGIFFYTKASSVIEMENNCVNCVNNVTIFPFGSYFAHLVKSNGLILMEKPTPITSYHHSRCGFIPECLLVRNVEFLPIKS